MQHERIITERLDEWVYEETYLGEHTTSLGEDYTVIGMHKWVDDGETYFSVDLIPT